MFSHPSWQSVEVRDLRSSSAPIDFGPHEPTETLKRFDAQEPTLTDVFLRSHVSQSKQAYSTISPTIQAQERADQRCGAKWGRRPSQRWPLRTLRRPQIPPTREEFQRLRLGLTQAQALEDSWTLELPSTTHAVQLVFCDLGALASCKP